MTQTCGIAGFVREVSLGQYFTPIYDVYDGFGGKTGSCREETLRRDQEDSESVEWIRRFPKLGPVLQVKVTHYSELFCN